MSEEDEIYEDVHEDEAKSEGINTPKSFLAGPSLSPSVHDIEHGRESGDQATTLADIEEDVQSVGTETLDKFLRHFAELSQARAAVHNIEAKRYRKIDTRLIQVPVIVITTVVSILSFASQHTDNAQRLLFSIGCAQLLVSILISVSTKFQFAKKSSLHKESSNRFSKYCLKCESILMKPAAIRPKQSRTLLAEFEKSYVAMVDIAPPISGWAQRQFKKRIKIPEGFRVPPALLEQLYVVTG